jgi:glycosyltransferase involved in cell wall biosynthesis
VKVLYIHQYFVTPEMSGGTRSYEMARRLAARGHEVHLITSDRSIDAQPGWRVEHVENFVVHWYGVPYSNAMSFGRRIWSFLSFAAAASIQGYRVGGDLVFATSTPLTIAVPGVIAKWGSRAPMVFEVRDLWPDLPVAVGALRNPLAVWMARKLERWAYRNSDAVIALSPGMAEGVAAAGYPPGKISVVPNSCDLDLFGVGARLGEDFRSRRPWLGKRPLIVYGGTLGHINDVSYLVRVAASAAEIDDSIAFMVVGQGVDARRIIDLAGQVGVWQKNFFYEESIPKQEMPALLSAATICTSLFAPIPQMEANSANKFFDALAAGRPVAINYGGWQAALLEDHDAGVVLDRDPREAASQLASLVADEQRLGVLGRNARGLAEERFARDALAHELVEVLVSVRARHEGELRH